MASEVIPDREAAVGIPGLWWKLGEGILFSVVILAGFLYVGPSEGFQLGGHGARIIFFHVPCAWLATLAYVVAAWYAAQYLRRYRAPGRPGAEESDFKCAAAMELGFLFAVLATVTGSIFSRNEWGAYWNWDPRQTSIVVVMLIFAAYLILRGGIAEPEARARLSSVYALVGTVPGVFLIWILPRIVRFTLHPNEAVVKNQISGNYRVVLYGLALPAFLALFVWLLQIRVRFLKLEARRSARSLS